MSRVVALSVVAVVIGASVGVGIVAAWATVGAPTQCIRAQPVATLQTLTPILIVNSPYGGYANGTATTWTNSSSGWSSSSMSTGARNGSVTYLFSQVNWTFWTTQRVGNPAGSCAGVFTYTEGPSQGMILLSSPRNYTNDSSAPSFSGGNGTLDQKLVTSSGSLAPLYFSDSFVQHESSGFQKCYYGGSARPAWSTYLDIQIPFEYAGSAQTAAITIDLLTNYTYSFPDEGAWSVDDLGTAGGPGGGDSFSYSSSCP